MKPKLLSKYDSTVDPGVSCAAGSLTEQWHKDDCDINHIMSRFAKLGVDRSTLLSMQQSQPVTFMDCTQFDFASVQQTVAEVKEQFMQLPSQGHARNGHEPAKEAA